MFLLEESLVVLQEFYRCPLQILYTMVICKVVGRHFCCAFATPNVTFMFPSANLDGLEVLPTYSRPHGHVIKYTAFLLLVSETPLFPLTAIPEFDIAALPGEVACTATPTWLVSLHWR